MAAPASNVNLKNIDINEVLKLDTRIDADLPSNSAAKLTDGAPVMVQSADETCADSTPLAVAAHPTPAPLEALDMNVERSEKKAKIEGSISFMAVSVADSSDSDYASVEEEGEIVAEEDSEAESVPLLPEIPTNSNEVAVRPCTDSDTSDSSSNFTFDVACKDGQNAAKTTAAATAPVAPPKPVRPPPIFVNNIEDCNITKKARLDLDSFKTLVLPADDVAAAKSEEAAKSGSSTCVSEEALASLSPTHIASDLLKYFVRTHAPAFMQRFVAPAQAPKKEEDAIVAVVTSGDAFGFGSPVDNIVREPAPWELTFGSPLEHVSRSPAPWADAVETEVDPLAVPLPDDEEITEERGTEKEEWKEMVGKKWHEDVPTSRLDLEAMRKEWDDYCAERSQKVAAMLDTEEKIAADEAKVEAAQVAFKELGATASINKRKISSPSRLNLCNLVQVNHDNIITKRYLDDIMSVASSIKHRLLEIDYKQQVWRRFTPSGPAFGTGLGIALEYPTSKNSQRDMRLAEDAAAQAMYYFENSCVEYVRPPVQFSRDEVDQMSAVEDNPGVFKQSGVILTHESDGLPFHCTVNRPPLDLAISQSRQRAFFRKRLQSDVWTAPPPLVPPGENPLIYKAGYKLKEIKLWIRLRSAATALEYLHKIKDAAVRIKHLPADLIIYLILGI